MKRSFKSSSVLLFLFGLGCCTQIYLYGCIAISELVAFVIAPILYIKNYSALRRLKFTTFLNMVLMLICSMLISSLYNRTPYPFVLKAFAALYSMFAYFIVFYALLKNNLNGLRWIFMGVFLSSIITIFAFNPTANVTAEGAAYIADSEVEDIISGQLFWLEKFKAFVQIPVCGFYMQFPLLLSLLAPVVFLGMALATTVSGRAASAAFLVSGAMIIIGRKKITSMKSIGKHFFSYVFVGIVCLFLVKQAYVIAAKNGYLSEDAQKKYERQSRQGNGLLTILMHGRTGFFAAIPAALNRPIFGYGPFARDDGGYMERFILEYGSEEDIQTFYMVERTALLKGYQRSLPSHSYIMGAWLHYGFGGLAFFLFVLAVIYQHIKRYSAAIPQWYGYFAMMLPYYIWSIFFSPFGYRWQFALLMACLFFARAVGDRRMLLSPDMLLEIKNYEK